ncbi:hypothetical protein ABI59_10385 [Acidobacteria bacterium Mor1]|nr:hypothetical protein ABI59_10385 [Acidobacteria bacterium Mor1]
MNVEIRSHRTCLSPKVRNRVENRAERSLSRAAAGGDLRVQLSQRDADHPRPGSLCRLLLVRPGRNPVLASASDPDLFSAIDKAFDRMTRRVRNDKDPRWARRILRRGAAPSRLATA